MRSRVRRLGSWALGAFSALAFVALLGNVAVLRAGVPRTDLAHAPPRDTVIVLGARVFGDAPSQVLEDRLLCALDLFRRGAATRILVSGDGASPAYDETGAMLRWLVARGVPSSAIVADPEGFRTHETMRRASSVYGVRSALVCTQRFHLARSVYLARAHGIDAVGIEADRRTYRGFLLQAAREVLSRTVAWLEIALR